MLDGVVQSTTRRASKGVVQALAPPSEKRRIFPRGIQMSSTHNSIWQRVIRIQDGRDSGFKRAPTVIFNFLPLPQAQIEEPDTITQAQSTTTDKRLPITETPSQQEGDGRGGASPPGPSLDLTWMGGGGEGGVKSKIRTK